MSTSHSVRRWRVMRFTANARVRHRCDPLSQLRVFALHRSLTDPIARKIYETQEIRSSGSQQSTKGRKLNVQWRLSAWKDTGRDWLNNNCYMEWRRNGHCSGCMYLALRWIRLYFRPWKTQLYIHDMSHFSRGSQVYDLYILLLSKLWLLYRQCDIVCCFSRTKAEYLKR